MVVHNKPPFQLLFLIFIINSFLGFGQTDIDSLQQKTYTELLTIFNSESDLKKRINSTEAWIRKAKRENNRKKIAVGYYNSAKLYDDITK